MIVAPQFLVAGVKGKTLLTIGYTVIAVSREFLLKGVKDSNSGNIVVFTKEMKVFKTIIAQSLKVADDKNIRTGPGYPAQFLQGLINSIFGRGEPTVQAVIEIINGVQELQNIFGTALRSNFSVIIAVKNQAANSVIILQCSPG
jgi:hypothetical protein